VVLAIVWPMAQLAITLEVLPDAVVMRLVGDADMHSVGPLEREVNRLAASRPKLVVIDATEVGFFSSLALSEFVSLHSALKTHGSSVAMVGVKGAAQDAVKRSRLDSVIKLFPTVEAALESKRAG
jgi:anti-anti-sigma factor